jgi:hypothetical protein
MLSICKNYISVNGSLYQIKRAWPEERIKNVDMVKDWLRTDTVFRKDNIMYFCQLIEEAEIINS